MVSRAERGHSRIGTVGKLLAAGGIVLGIGGAVEACGGGDNSPSNTGQRTETPGTLPSKTTMATQITESPTPEPTPTATVEHLYDPPPTFDELSTSLSLAFSNVDVTNPEYAGDYHNVIEIALSDCNFPVTNINEVSFAENGCRQVGETMRYLFLKSKTGNNDFLVAMEKTRDFLMGRFDDFFKAGLLKAPGSLYPQTSDELEKFKKHLIEKSFSLSQ